MPWKIQINFLENLLNVLNSSDLIQYIKFNSISIEHLYLSV